ncbi:hypothetical protein [Chitinimonas sp.]|uniref:hypothetical protein n=1 Tax=Chitinimonas sp. TaxID=1934313 RepID=UPI002F940259
MHRGTQQDQRLSDALLPGYFLPDEFSLAERIRLSLAQAACLRFVAGEHLDAGSWDEALLQDETVLLADLAAFPLARLQSSFLEAMAWSAEATLWQRTWQLAQRYDLWWQGLGEAPSSAGKGVAEAMRGQVRQGLAALLAQAVAVFGLGAGQLHPLWRDTLAQAAERRQTAEPAGRQQLLRRTWLGLCQAIGKLQPKARAELPASYRSGQHEPSMALLLATLELFQYSRAPLNRFPERLTEFYYRDLLRMRARPAAVERVHLLLERDPKFTGTVTIPAGTRFVGGKDQDGQVIEFAAEQHREVSDARVAALYSLRLERDALISPEREFGYATRVKVEALPLLPPDAAYGIRPPWWPLLGGQAKGSAARTQDARIGLAIASPLLQMKEGRREVHLRLQLAHPAEQDDGLLGLLRVPMGQRDQAWLERAYARYADLEAQLVPLRPRPGATPVAPSPSLLAAAAWQRSAVFGEDVLLSFLLARCLVCDDPQWFAECLGRLFAMWLVAGKETLRLCDLVALRRHAQTLRGSEEIRAVEIDDPLILISPVRPVGGGQPEGDAREVALHTLPDRALIFDRVFAGIWQGQLSTSEGWLSLDGVYTHRRPVEESALGWGGGLELVLRLGPEQAPVVACEPALHGQEWPAQAVLQLTLRSQSRMYAYSLLQQCLLQDVVLSVNVSGLRDLVLYNQLGRLDPAKPFQPFGPLPDRHAYLQWGSAELAGKPLDALRMRLRWGALPDDLGGFASHYQGYPGRWSNDGFQVVTQMLLDGQWQSGSAEPLPMFRQRDSDRTLLASATLTVPEADLRRLHRPVAIKPGPYLFDLQTRNGFFRFELSEPAAAFGHGLYSQLLTDTLARNARRKRPAPLPLAPYTPVIDSLSVDYRASRTLKLAQEPGITGQDGVVEGVYYLHAAGLQPVHATPGGCAPSLLPQYPQDGNLYIGLEGSDPQGALSLFFHLRKEEAAERWLQAVPQLQWSAWCGSGWQVLKPFQLLSDSTQALLRSGIVQLSLPAEMNRHCPHLPGQYYWLKLSANWGFDLLAGLYGVHAQALTASRVTPAKPEAEPVPLPPATIDQPLQGMAGLRSVLQVGPSFDLRTMDAPSQWLTRSAERLRHKARAVTIWDYERLLLDRFPDICKVKCFPHQQPTHRIDEEDLVPSEEERSPGHVLLVVVPAPHHGSLFHSTEAPRLDASRLDAMSRYLRERCPAGVRLVVRNAAYERIQVRCAVRLLPATHVGTAMRLLNQAIVEYLSPWHEGGYGAEFDWEIRSEVLEAYLRSQPYVQAVSQLSLLHIVRSDRDFHALRDTARQAPAQDTGLRRVTPEQPWSLALPTRHHLIDVVDQDDRLLPPQGTGLARLEVGNTFIVGGLRGDLSEEG